MTVYIERVSGGISNPTAPNTWQYEITVGFNQVDASQHMTGFSDGVQSPSIGNIAPNQNLDGDIINLIQMNHVESSDTTVYQVGLDRQVSQGHIDSITFFNDSTSRQFVGNSATNFQSGAGFSFWQFGVSEVTALWDHNTDIGRIFPVTIVLSGS